MLIPTNQVKSNTIYPSATAHPHHWSVEPTAIESLDHPERDMAARRPFEQMMVAELTRRFGDRRSYFDDATRDWSLHVVRNRYWWIWSYLIVSTGIWLVVMAAGIIGAFAILDPRRTSVTFLFISFLVSLAIAPVVEAVERRLCANWVLGLKARRPQSKPASGTVAASERRNRAA